MANEAFVVDIAPILDLPEGRIKDILAKKAVAGFFGLKHTRELKGQEIHSTEDAVDALYGLQEHCLGYRLRPANEPLDPSDRSASPVSLASFCRHVEATEARITQKALEDSTSFAEGEDWLSAADVLLEGLDVVLGHHRASLIRSLEGFVDHSEEAKLAYGRALFNGDNIARDEARGEQILRDGLLSDDAELAAFAHMTLGYRCETTPGRAWEAIRHFESAGNLGREDGYELAGVSLQLGVEGVPPNFVRAAANYRRGADGLGCPRCKARHALMVLNGQVDYDESWRTDFRAALAEGETIATRLAPIVRRAEQVAGGDARLLVEAMAASLSGIDAEEFHF